MRAFTALSLTLLLVGAAACGGEDPADQTSGDKEAGTSTSTKTGGGVEAKPAEPPTCGTDLQACAAASPEGDWTQSEVCTDVNALAEEAIVAMAKQHLNCDGVKVLSAKHGVEGMSLKIAGERYERGGVLKADGAISIPFSCIPLGALGCTAANMSGKLPGTCAPKSGGCECTMTWEKDFADVGAIEVEGDSLSFTSDKASNVKTSAQFCVQGSGMLIESTIPGINLKIRDLWTRR